MNYLLLALLFLLSGVLMKLSDDAYDVSNNMLLALISGGLCAICCGFATVFNVGAAYIFIAILIGNMLAFKVDGIHHIITLLIFILLCVIFHIPDLNIIILLICILSALLDEIGHELINKITENKFANLFFEYRFVMKIVVFLLAICGVFNIWIFVFFILFELGYEFCGALYKNLS